VIGDFTGDAGAGRETDRRRGRPIANLFVQER